MTTDTFQVAISSIAIAKTGFKPNAAQFTNSFENKELSLTQFAQNVKRGYSFCAQHKNQHRKLDNFQAANWIAADYDHPDSLDAILNNEIVKKHACLIYPTPSHTPAQARFRAVFRLDNVVSDASEYINIKTRFFNSLGGLDAGLDLSCKDAVKFFYGCLDAETIINEQAEPISIEELEKQIKPDNKPFQKKERVIAHSQFENSESIRDWIEQKALSTHLTDRSSWFQSVVSSTFLKFGEQVVLENADFINSLTGNKYHGRIEQEILRSLSKAPARQPARRTQEPQEPARKKQELQQSQQSQEPAQSLFECSELGNSYRYIEQNCENVRFCGDFGGWFVWTGKVWKLDNEKARELAKETVLNIYDEIAVAVSIDLKQADVLARWAKSSQSQKQITNLLELAKTDPRIFVKSSEFDKNKMLFNTLNGTVDFNTLQFRAHDRRDMLTKIADFEFDAGATCTTWTKFLNKIFSGNFELIAYLQAAIGYSLTGDTTNHAVFFCYGLGSNGKSTFLNTIANLCSEYSRKMSFTSLLVKDKGHNGTASPDIARLVGARYVFASEPGAGAGFDEASLKELTGGELITTRFLFQNEFSFKPEFKLWLAGNSRPAIKGQDLGIWRRMKLIPFEITISDAEKDFQLEEKLKAEIPGIFNWAMAGCLAWQTRGLADLEPEIVKIATASYKAESDILKDFITDCLIKSDKKTKNTEVYKQYCLFCQNEDDRAMSKKNFYAAMAERGYSTFEATGYTYFKNISLKSLKARNSEIESEEFQMSAS